MSDTRNRTQTGTRWILAVVCVAAFISTATLDFLDMVTVAASADTAQSAATSDEKRLIGRWVRPDGGYILELKEVKKDGTIKAAYFNPRPINVAKAEFKHKDSMLTVFVELRDVNYPGSTYNLLYEPNSDSLIGTYFQAVQGLTYDIEFRRAK